MPAVTVATFTAALGPLAASAFGVLLIVGLIAALEHFSRSGR